MSVDNISPTAASSYYSAQANNKASTNQAARTTESSARVIKDNVDLSSTALMITSLGRLDLSAIPDISETGLKFNLHGFSSIDEMMEYGRALGEFHKSKRPYHDQRLALHNKLIHDANGLLNGVSYNADDLSKPIRATDGSIHPKADEIRAFLKNHQAERNTMKQLMVQISKQFMSVEQWREVQAKAATA